MPQGATSRPTNRYLKGILASDIARGNDPSLSKGIIEATRNARVMNQQQQRAAVKSGIGAVNEEINRKNIAQKPRPKGKR